MNCVAVHCLADELLTSDHSLRWIQRLHLYLRRHNQVQYSCLPGERFVDDNEYHGFCNSFCVWFCHWYRFRLCFGDSQLGDELHNVDVGSDHSDKHCDNLSRLQRSNGHRGQR